MSFFKVFEIVTPTRAGTACLKNAGSAPILPYVAVAVASNARHRMARELRNPAEGADVVRVGVVAVRNRRHPETDLWPSKR